MEFRQGRCIDTRVIFPTTTTTTIKTTFVNNDLETTEPEDTTTIPIPLESTPKGDSRVIVASVDQTTRFAFTVTTTTTSTTTHTTTTTTNAKPSTTTSTTSSPVTERLVNESTEPFASSADPLTIWSQS